jgi:hypothetical protein
MCRSIMKMAASMGRAVVDVTPSRNVDCEDLLKNRGEFP